MWSATTRRIVTLQHRDELPRFVLDKVPIFPSHSADLKHVPNFFSCCLHLQSCACSACWAIIHNGRVLANRQNCMACQGGHSEELRIRVSKGKLLCLAEHVHHSHPALCVSVAHPESHPRPACDDLVRHVAVCSHAVPHHGQSSDDLDSLWLLSCNRGHQACHCCGTALVSGHSCHDTSSLNVSTTSVIGDTLAHQVDSFLDVALRLVGKPKHTAVVAGHRACGAIHSSQARIFPLEELLSFLHFNADLGPRKALGHILLNPWSSHALRIRAPMSLQTTLPCSMMRACFSTESAPAQPRSSSLPAAFSLEVSLISMGV